jgi:hypothetical protein
VSEGKVPRAGQYAPNEALRNGHIGFSYALQDGLDIQSDREETPMTLQQPAAVLALTLPGATRGPRHRPERSLRERAVRAREARARLNRPRARGDFAHLARVYD